MKFIQSTPRNQVPFLGACLEQAISPENEVRYIDAFVDSLPLQKLGFRLEFAENGRPAYHPATLLWAIYLWISQPHPLLPLPGEGMSPQY